jgi:hypothetical protein
MTKHYVYNGGFENIHITNEIQNLLSLFNMYANSKPSMI